MRHHNRPAFLQNVWLTLLTCGVLAVIVIGIVFLKPAADDKDALIVYCAAGMRKPVEAIARAYEKAYGVRVQLQYGGSHTLLANIEVAKRGDLYIPADDWYVRLAQEKKLIDEVLPLAEMKPVIAVKKGNPKNVRSLADLLAGQVRLSQANPDAAAIGKATRDALGAEKWAKLKSQTQVFKLTVNDVANDVLVGAVDAGIVWDSTVAQYPGLEMIASPELAGKKAHVCVAVLKASQQPTAALRFARFLAARDKGLEEFQRFGFSAGAIEGDVWAETPELRLFAGAMLKVAIKDTITAFEKREGVKVTTVFNGCGILVAQMKTGSHPDAYFACEKSFMNQVHDLFLEPIDISSNRLAIVVRKGNPLNIKTLEDLGRPNLRVGVGHEQQCALGALTQMTLVEGKLQKTVSKNVTVRTATGDLLVNQLRTGSLDAVIAYVSNAANIDDVEAHAIEGINCATAIQPWAVGKESQHRQLAGRLLDAIRSSQSQERFATYGFGWKDGK